MTDKRDRRVLLEAQRDELTSKCFDELKARSDALLIECPGRALEIAEVALQAASFASAPLAEAIARWARGNALAYLGQYAPALKDYGQACTIISEQGEDKLAVARLQSNVVAVLKHLGRYTEALEMADVARDAIGPWGQSRYLAALEMNVGSIYRLLGRYEDALAVYERGRSIFSALGDQVQAGRMDINRARALVCMDRFHEAEPLLQAAGRVLAQESKFLPAARADLNLATLLSRQGRHREALEIYGRARRAFAVLNVETDVAVTDLYRTYDYLALNLLPEAMELAAEAREVLVRRKMPRYVALAAGNQAIATRKMGLYVKSLDHLLAAREILAERESVIEIALLDLERAVCLRETGELEKAIAVASEATNTLVAHNLPLRTAHARLVLADCLLTLGKVERAAPLYVQARQTLAGMPSLDWWAHDGLGRVAEARGRMEEAYTHYQRAIACIETAEDELGIDEFRAGFLDDKLPVYRRAVRLALALGNQGEAFGYIEQSKSGVWRDFLAQEGTKGNKQSQLQILRQKWHWLYSRLTRPDEENSLRGREAETYWSELHALEKQISQARRDRGLILERLSGLSLSSVQRRMSPATLLLDYYCTDKEIVAFLISTDKIRVFERLASLAAMERLVNRWQFNIESVRMLVSEGLSTLPSELSDEAHQILYDLHCLLLEPLESHLENCRSLQIVPHDLLWAVPFPALHDGRQYLVEKLEIAYLPGVVMLRRGETRKVMSWLDAPLVVGYSDGGWLSHAVSEAQTVSAGLNNAKLLLEAQATMAQVQESASLCTLLHLATHGVFRFDAPLFSSVSLADGWLTAGDLEEWRMPKAELVTLSACETGMSQSWGSDLLGLARGFFRAGTRRLVASQWAVDDVSTAALMTHFYKALREGKTVAAAMQKAQVAAMTTFPHPFYWAGFGVMELL